MIANSSLGTFGTAGLVLIVIGVGWYVVKRFPVWWDAHSKHELKKARTIEAFTKREAELKALVEEILSNGLKKARGDQKINLIEHQRVTTWLNGSLGMNILTKEDADRIKQEIKSRLAMARDKKSEPVAPTGSK